MQPTSLTRAAAAAIALVLALLLAAPASAALTCEQLIVIAETAVRYRDQGYTLNQVLAELKSVDRDNRLTAAELDVLRNSVSLVYLGNASPKEVALECVQAREAGKR
jgi:hypothetical protein